MVRCVRELIFLDETFLIQLILYDDSLCVDFRTLSRS